MLIVHLIITVTAPTIGNQCAHRPPDRGTPGIRRGVCLYLGPDRHFLQGAFDSGSPCMSASLPAGSVVQRHRLLCVGYPWKRTIFGVFVCILSKILSRYKIRVQYKLKGNINKHRGVSK